MGLKEDLRARRKTIGTWLTIGHPCVVEILADAGFSWITVDMEHTTISLENAQNLTAIAQGLGLEVMIRVAKNEEVVIKRCLDMGANGVIVPNIRSREEAKMAVDHALYPPHGKRGVGLYRAQKYGYGFESYRDQLKDQCIIIGQIEHIDAVHQIDEIFDIDEIDGYIIGPYDLSGSMGFPGEFDREDVREAIEKVHLAAKQKKKALGMHSVPPDPDRCLNELKKGFDFAAYSTDFYFMSHTARTHLKQIEEELQ